jgi:hypothetical protein
MLNFYVFILKALCLDESVFRDRVSRRKRNGQGVVMKRIERLSDRRLSDLRTQVQGIRKRLDASLTRITHYSQIIHIEEERLHEFIAEEQRINEDISHFLSDQASKDEGACA